ncbi:MAG: hypothetical protein COV07_00740 [Candidatus Vogelbacteria bacterium CG10_big_fil_rev_8_21_14_0_10_45_14]|uniref:SHSP domain-containing protein n=1 Tax=Candidatus Vogelbacteria bacterium CG10_big_fil_rev_8_21_14_0_10_45_14 TaxID=1975042 RepID=A0A2H0RMX8_9BACT|nr:MAG: hypothetical protein COV07_00740 [Candidatus Vogelbacteria bacterium CG10_big_fil_rev_8_21_14_0_10_45_14]
MSLKRRSFFEKLTGSVHVDDDDDLIPVEINGDDAESDTGEEEDGELSIDMYQTNTDIILRAVIAGCRPEDVEVDIARDSVRIKGERHEKHEVHEDDYYHRELYWGSFTRTIKLPAEVEPQDAEAVEKHGILTLKLPKIDKARRATVKVKTA